MADQICATCNADRNIKRWPMVVFFAMINVAVIHSQVIYLGYCFGKTKKKDIFEDAFQRICCRRIDQTKCEYSRNAIATSSTIAKISPAQQRRSRK